MNTLILILSAIYESLWRRWFGGANIGGEKYKDSFFNGRFLKHIINCIYLFLIFNFLKEFNYLTILYCILIIEILFWSKGHPALDMGRSIENEESKERYNKVWFSSIISFLVPKNHHYLFGYDFLWMTVRYSYPLVLLLPFYSYFILFLGILVPIIYSICWSLSEKLPNLFKKVSFIKSAKDLAEILVGFLSGIFFIL